MTMTMHKDKPHALVREAVLSASRGQIGNIEQVKVKGDAESDIRLVTFKAASELPIIRQGWDFDYKEWTDMDGLKTEWLDSGNMPFLTDHRNLTENIVGRIRSGQIVKKIQSVSGSRKQVKFLEVKAEFNLRDPESRKAYEKVEAGMLRNVSIGYSANPNGLEVKKAKDPEKDGYDYEVVFRDWQVNEVSLVSVPADEKVGFGREASKIIPSFLSHREVTKMPDELKEQITTPATEAEKTADVNVNVNVKSDAPATPAAEAVDVPLAEVKADATATEQRTADRTDEVAKALTYVAKERSKWQTKYQFTDDEVDTVINEINEKQLGVDAVKQAIFDAIEKRDTTATAGVGKGVAPAVLNQDARHNQFSMARLFEMKAKDLPLDGIEAEVVAETEAERAAQKVPSAGAKSSFVSFKALAQDPDVRAIVAPDAQRAFAVGNTPSGPFHQEFDESWFVAALFAPAKTLSRIRRMPQMLVQDLVGVTETGTLSVYHTAENGARAESTGLSYGNRTMEWHQINARADVSQRSLDQSRYFFPRLLANLRRDLVRGVNNTLLNGSGANTPTGLLQANGTTSFDVGTNGGAPDWAKMVEGVTKLAANNAMADQAIYVTTPEVLGKLQSISKFTGSQGTQADSIVQYQGTTPYVNGHEVVVDNNLPKNLTKGTGRNLHPIICFDPSEVVWGTFSGLELVVDNITQINTGQVRSYIRLAYDISIDHLDAIAIAKDVDPS